MSSRFSEGREGREIIDSVVVGNSDRNYELFEKTRTLPPYFGYVNIGEKSVKLTTGKGKKGKRLLIHDIIADTKNITMDDGDPKIIVEENGMTYVYDKTSANIIKLIKVCIAHSFSVNEEYSEVVSEFVKAVIKTAGEPIIPVELPKRTELQKIVGEQLNEFLQQLYDEDGIKYTTVFGTKADTKFNKMLSAASQARMG